MYTLKAYFYSLLASNRSAKQFQLAIGGWMNDDAGKLSKEDNTGYTTRKLWTTSTADGVTVKTKNVYLAGQLFLDVALQKQYLLDKMDITIKFLRNEHVFCLQSFDNKPDDYKVRFLSMSLWMRRVQVSPSVIVGHMQGLQKMNAVWKYPAIKICHSYHKAGITCINSTNVAPGIYPKCIFVGMVDNKGFCGDFTKAPYEFQNFNIKSIGMMMNGSPVPSTAFRPDFATENIAREYLTLFLATGSFGINDDDNGILLKDWANGMCLFPFTFSPDLSLNGHEQPIRMNNIRMDIEFKTELASNMVLLLFCICDTLFEFSGNGVVHLDPTQSAS